MEGERESFKAIPEMDQAFLTKLQDLPTEIITNIFARLPIRSIMCCKCVCKTWFRSIKTPEFTKLQFLKSVPGLIVYEDVPSDIFRIFEIEDEQQEHHYFPLMKFHRKAVISHPDGSILIEGSANGFVLLSDKRESPGSLYMCNPVTREFFRLPNPEAILYDLSVVLCGFGVTEKTDEHKVVGIFNKYVQDETGRLEVSFYSECRVYTLGTGLWRKVVFDSSLACSCIHSKCAVLKGNLHWMMFKNASNVISCFNLETELFHVFSPPPHKSRKFVCDVGVLGDHLCLCDNTYDDKVVIWVMKEYGVEQSWRKQIVMSKLFDCYKEVANPIKVFKNGDILLSWVEYSSHLVLYSKKSKTTSLVKMSELEGGGSIQARLHASSFVSLRRFALENVDESDSFRLSENIDCSRRRKLLDIACTKMSPACLVCHGIESLFHSFRSYSVSSSDNEGRCSAVRRDLVRDWSFEEVVMTDDTLNESMKRFKRKTLIVSELKSIDLPRIELDIYR